MSPEPAMTQTSDPHDPVARDLEIETIADSELWAGQANIESTLRNALSAAAIAASVSRAELAIVLTDDSAVRALNRDWRGIDKATNVLSFPAAQVYPGPLRHLGDIVIAYETTAAEAAAEGKRFSDHAAHLAVHGFLHLIGHDHENERDAEAMELLETLILARIGIGDPYAASEAAAANHV